MRNSEESIFYPTLYDRPGGAVGREKKVWQASRACQTWQESYFVGAGVVAGLADIAAAPFALFFDFLL